MLRKGDHVSDQEFLMLAVDGELSARAAGPGFNLASRDVLELSNT